LANLQCVTEWFEVFKWPPPPRLEVARGPAAGQWSFVAYVSDRETAEAVLERWRHEHPGQTVALLRNGVVIEDARARTTRLARERREREAAYFERLAAEADVEGKPESAQYYRDCAARFR
jgi:hypothetical protein